MPLQTPQNSAAPSQSKVSCEQGCELVFSIHHVLMQLEKKNTLWHKPVFVSPKSPISFN